MERGNSLLRFLDHYLGPILLLLLAPFLSRRRRCPAQLSSIAILKTAAIGDTVLVSALVSDLVAQGIQVTLFTGASNYEFAKLISGVARVERLPLIRPWQALRIIRLQKFDVFIDADSWPRISALFTALSRSSFRVGFRTQGQRRHYLYDVSVEHSDGEHELENYRNLLRTLDLQPSSFPQNLGFPWDLSRSENLILFHLWPGGTRSYLKEWNFENWQSLATELLKQGSFSFGLTGAPADHPRVESFLRNLPTSLANHFKNFAGLRFCETLGVLQRAQLLVSVNTGIMHVAAAMGVPTVGLHGPTNPQRWGPIGSRVKSILSHTEGAGALNLGFEYRDEINRMDGILVPEVLQACRDLLSGARMSQQDKQI